MGSFGPPQMPPAHRLLLPLLVCVRRRRVVRIICTALFAWLCSCLLGVGWESSVRCSFVLEEHACLYRVYNFDCMYVKLRIACSCASAFSSSVCSFSVTYGVRYTFTKCLCICWYAVHGHARCGWLSLLKLYVYEPHLTCRSSICDKAWSPITHTPFSSERRVALTCHL